MAEARDRILRMLSEGKVTPEEAAELLDALASASGKGGKRTLKIEVETDEGKCVKLKLPQGMLRLAKRFISKELAEELREQDIDLDELVSAAQDGDSVEVLDVETPDGKRVKIRLE